MVTIRKRKQPVQQASREPVYAVTVEFSGSQTFELDFESLTGEPYKDFREHSNISIENGEELFLRSLYGLDYQAASRPYEEILDGLDAVELVSGLSELNMFPDNTQFTINVKLISRGDAE